MVQYMIGVQPSRVMHWKIVLTDHKKLSKLVMPKFGFSYGMHIWPSGQRRPPKPIRILEVQVLSSSATVKTSMPSTMSTSWQRFRRTPMKRDMPKIPNRMKRKSRHRTTFAIMGRDSSMAETSTRMPGSTVTVRSGRRTRMVRMDETLVTPGKSATRLAATTMKSMMFHPSRM